MSPIEGENDSPAVGSVSAVPTGPHPGGETSTSPERQSGTGDTTEDGSFVVAAVEVVSADVPHAGTSASPTAGHPGSPSTSHRPAHTSHPISPVPTPTISSDVSSVIGPSNPITRSSPHSVDSSRTTIIEVITVTQTPSSAASGAHPGTVAAAVLGSLVGFSLLAGLAFWFFKRRKEGYTPVATVSPYPNDIEAARATSTTGLVGAASGGHIRKSSDMNAVNRPLDEHEPTTRAVDAASSSGGSMHRPLRLVAALSGRRRKEEAPPRYRSPTP